MATQKKEKAATASTTTAAKKKKELPLVQPQQAAFYIYANGYPQHYVPSELRGNNLVSLAESERAKYAELHSLGLSYVYVDYMNGFDKEPRV